MESEDHPVKSLNIPLVREWDSEQFIGQLTVSFTEPIEVSELVNAGFQLAYRKNNKGEITHLYASLVANPPKKNKK